MSVTHPFEESNTGPVVTEPDDDPHITGLSVGYDRKFNTGNFTSLRAAITIWARILEPELPLDLHDCRHRLRHMARENVRAQINRFYGKQEAILFALLPPRDGPDPILVRTVSLTLNYKDNLGDFNGVGPDYTDWADVRHLSTSPEQLHIALARMWTSLWVNVEDELARASGQPMQEMFYGWPTVEVSTVS